MPPDTLSESERDILKTLHDTGLALSPQVIAYNLGLSRHWCNSRLLLLRNAGLINRVSRGLYQINPVGTACVTGTLNPEIETTVTNTIDQLRNQVDA